MGKFIKYGSYVTLWLIEQVLTVPQYYLENADVTVDIMGHLQLTIHTLYFSKTE